MKKTITKQEQQRINELLKKRREREINKLLQNRKQNGQAQRNLQS